MVAYLLVRFAGTDKKFPYTIVTFSCQYSTGELFGGYTGTARTIATVK